MVYSESMISSSSYSDKTLITSHESTHGVHKVKYSPHEEWDYVVDSPYDPIDVSMALPHYRAHNQPISYRMGMLVAAHSKPVKVKVCRPASQRSKFLLHVQAQTSDVTVWLPSDFRGRISYSSKPCYSAGFVNRIMSNAYLSNIIPEEEFMEEEEDEVIICTSGRISLRMWDVNTCAPENTQKETLKRMFGCKHRAPETTIDWDFLLADD